MSNKVKNTAKGTKKVVKTTETAEIKIVNTPVQASTPAPAIEEKPKLGRPVNPESERQKRLAEIQEKRAQGLIKRGRPIVEGSAHQQKLKAQAERKAANGGKAYRGRPVDPNSPRQQRLAAMAAKIAAGMEIKRGRPAGTNNNVTAENVQVSVSE